MMNNEPSTLVRGDSEVGRRVRSPEETLEWIEPIFSNVGITRLADITWLDRLGMPCFSSIRPTALALQTSNGKGRTKLASKVSAAMEAIELFHVENSSAYELVKAAETELQKYSVIPHTELPSFLTAVHYDRDDPTLWFEGINVRSETSCFAPACSIFFDQDPNFHVPTTNGLASGNHRTEALLHGLYELLERDAGSRISISGKLKIRERTSLIDINSIRVPFFQEHVERLMSHTKPLVFFVKSPVEIYTFWVILLGTRADGALTTFATGWGTHLDREIALSRAVTEAAQSRVGIIQGSREDIMTPAGAAGLNVISTKVYKYFDSLEPTQKWTDLPNSCPELPLDLSEEWQILLKKVLRGGFSDIFAFDLMRDDIRVPVMKVIVPGLQFNQRMF
jgi:ribosomal protein S12 methylthiotransferase accessory factor